jgi:hypothetical protein
MHKFFLGNVLALLGVRLTSLIVTFEVCPTCLVLIICDVFTRVLVERQDVETGTQDDDLSTS